MKELMKTNVKKGKKEAQQENVNERKAEKSNFKILRYQTKREEKEG